MKRLRSVLFIAVFGIIGLWAQTAYARVSYMPRISKAAAAYPNDKFAVVGSRIMFYGGISILVLLCIGLAVFAYKLIPKTEKIRTCPVEEFVHARQIAIYLPRSNDIILKPGSKYFTELINNFTGDKKAASDDDRYSDKLFLKIKNRRYAIEASLDGWNFEGELRNSRVLSNPLEVRKIIDSLKEEYLKK
ncbi:MAG: hypothetical protein WC532_00235 [Candidatus Omnitrophota bacterium]